ncbi:helix-hairpin-helix domain-containing protein, partial [bacterium]|nr:helix-hairpin-helix domain-containing protein [bacterium]
NNEKIDVINWHADPGLFISRSLSPAKVYKVIVDQGKKKAIAVLTDDQISLAIGRGGQNRRLASRLTGYDIEIIKESEYRKIIEEKLGENRGYELEEVPGLTPSMLKNLHEAGFSYTEEVLKAGTDGLVRIPGIGEKTAKKIIETLDDYDE